MVARVRLIDSCFGDRPSSLGGENTGLAPKHFRWCRDNNCDSVYTWYTNWQLRQALEHNAPRKVAWLLEPPSLQDAPYQFAAWHREQFDAIMTYDRALLESGDTRFRFAPHGGSWVAPARWGLRVKSKNVCMIVSQKRGAVGHRFRHEIARTLGERVDRYGRAYWEIEHKHEALADYRYAIVVESMRMDYYFSEKLIDALAMGCVPIYWGCPSISDFFDPLGIITFQTLDQVMRIVEAINPDDYAARLEAVGRNIGKAREYFMPENWLFDHHKELFR